MSTSARAIASRICNLIPAIERAVSSELRRSSPYVTPSHLGLLAALARGPASLSRLSEMLAVSLPTMSNSVTTFVERGWVKRDQSEEDRRFIKIELTAKGRKALVDIRRRAELLLTARLAPLPPAKRKEVNVALKVLQEAFQPKVEDAADCTLTRTSRSRTNPRRSGRR